MSVLEVRDLSVHYGRRRRRQAQASRDMSAGELILDGVSFSVQPGECLAIVGESGAGKSVLTRTLLGLVQADPEWQVKAAGFSVAGQDMRTAPQRTWRTLRGSTVGLILQDALQSLDPLRTIEAEVGEALAVRDRAGLWRRFSAGMRSSIGRPAAPQQAESQHAAPQQAESQTPPQRTQPTTPRRAQVLDALLRAGLPNAELHLRQRSGELSGGMRQRALIASALVGDPQLVVADEPTTALDPTTAAQVLELFASIRARGTALLLISHDLQSVSRIADRVAVLDRGRIVEIGEASQILRHPQHPATQRLVAAAPSGPKPGPPPAVGPPILTVHNATRSFATRKTPTLALDDVTLILHRGEAVGVLGESGAGKTTLARVLVGAEQLDAGEVTRTKARVRLVPQDPMATFDPRWRVGRIIGTSKRLPGTTVAELLGMVGLDPELASRHPTTLSGGQRQRVAIARALAADPDVLVCDEPVSALDVATQAGILSLLRELQRDRALTLVFVSHDLAALRTVSDRVMVMRDGRVVEQGPTEEVFAGLPS